MFHGSVITITNRAAGHKARRPVLLCHRFVVKTYLYILSVVSECTSEDRKPSDVLGVVLYLESECDVALVVQSKLIDSHIRDLKTIDEGSLMVYDEEF